jgi:hypothetical protein
VRIVAQIANKGTINACNVQVKFFIDELGGPIDITTATVDIPSNSTITREILWRANRAGENFPITVHVDPFNLFEELLETNNEAFTYLTVTASTNPNLTISYQDLVFTPTPGLERGNTNISTLIKNDGFSQTSNIVVNFYKGVPGQDGVLLGSQTIPSLNAGESSRVSIDWTNIMESGEKIIYVQVDPLNQINEVREDDNSAFTTLQILSLPDFVISTNSITFDPSAPKDGDMVTINVTVQNKGEQGTQNVLVRASEGATVIGSQVIPSIAGNSQAMASFAYNTTGKTGPHQITVVVDPDNTIIEQSESNNQGLKTFGVQNANLWLTEPYISPNGDGIKDSTQFFFRLNNPQTVVIAVVNEKGETVKLFSGSEFENTSGGNVTWDGKNDNGVVVADGDYQIQVLDPNNNNMGSLLVVVDNNRSPLVKAIGTKYLLNNNLTCMLPDFWPFAWLPDESGILFHITQRNANTPEYPTGLYTMAPNGEDILRIVPYEWTKGVDPKYDYWIGGYLSGGNYSLSPDGRKVMFTLDKYNRIRGLTELNQLWTVDIDGRNLTLIVSYDTQQGFRGIGILDWSPDSEYIAYRVSAPNQIYELWIAKPDGTGKTRIDSGVVYIESFKWSPDGEYVAYVERDTSQLRQLWIAKPDGTEKIRIDSDGEYIGSLNWFSDGVKVTYLYRYGGSSKIRVSDTVGNKETIFEINGDLNSLEWLIHPRLFASIYQEGVTSPYSFWSIDVTGNGNNIKISDFEESPEISIAPDRQSIAFKTGGEWRSLNLYVSNLIGNLQNL